MATNNAQTFTIGGVTHQIEDVGARQLIASLQESLNALTGEGESKYIENLREVLDFLSGITDATTLTNIITEIYNEISGKYALPSGGIPNQDLAGGITKSKLDAFVQASLDKADSAIQSSDISGLLASVEYDETSQVLYFYGFGEEHIPPGDISNYVQQGLVLHLDGIEKGGIEGQWTDLIDGIDFPNHGATPIEKGWQFDGIDDYLGYANNSQKSLNYIAGNCTVEVAYYDDTINEQDGSVNAGMFLVALGRNVAKGSNDTNAIYLNPGISYNAKYINGMYVGATQNVWQDTKIETVNPHTLSVNKERAFDNELALTSLGTNHWDNIGYGRTIGAKYHSGQNKLMNFARGKIYSIRIYNRILTESEMRHNQIVDNHRFELGLTLPEEEDDDSV